MLIGIEFIISIGAIAAGIALFVLALRGRPVRGTAAVIDDTGVGIMKSNLYSLAIIALLFFGTAFLVDVFS